MPNKNSFVEELYGKYYRFVYNEAWKYYSISFDVDDVVQETWLKLCGKADILYCLSEAQTVAYIGITVKHIAISLARKRDVVISLEVADRIPYYEAEVLHDIIDRKDKLRSFRKLWTLVPKEPRELLERKYIFHESDAEIAAEMGIQKASVRMYLTRARRTAYEILEKHKDALV